MTPALFTPPRPRGLAPGERIACSPTTRRGALDGTARPRHRRLWHRGHVGDFAAFGAGPVVPGGAVAEAVGRVTPNRLRRGDGTGGAAGMGAMPRDRRRKWRADSGLRTAVHQGV